MHLTARITAVVFGLTLTGSSVLAQAPVPADALAHARALDTTLRAHLLAAGVRPLDAGTPPDANIVELGRMLFYDRLLSGNRDTSCATCHHDDFSTADGLSHSIGTRGLGLGPQRLRATDRKFTRRNATDLFNRGLPEWRTQFWDSRVARVPEGFLNPAGLKLPPVFSHVLEVQAMFPVTSRDEMRGKKGDHDAFGNLNELALIDDDDQPAMWEALMHRLLGPEGAHDRRVPGYRQLFAAAYPRTPTGHLGFEHAAIAIAAYERSAFTLLDSPWDQYVAGNAAALTPEAKRGAMLFYGRAKCASCHSGSLLTDQEHHNILVPHIGSRRLTDSNDDTGLHDVTKHPLHRSAFRTPPLRNVAATGPWMHNGAYSTLEAAVRHHLDPVGAFAHYDPRHLQREELRFQVHNAPHDLRRMLPTLSKRIAEPPVLTDAEVADLVHFLHALTSPSLGTLQKNIPATVPSGLPIDGREGR